MYKQMTRKGFTAIELVVAVAVLAICLTVIIGGGSWLLSGCGSQLGDNLIVNPFHSSTAQIMVRGTYFGHTDTGNLYRVVGNVVQDSDGGSGTETFEVSDGFIDGNFRTADLFAELLIAEGTSQVFEIEMRGERSGISGGGSFRQIRSVTAIIGE